MTNRLHLAIILLLFYSLPFSQRLLAQNYYGFPSSENAFLGKSGSGGEGLDVDKYTGRLLVNIPLTQLVSKNYAVPVSLNYTGGGGIRHQEYAGSTGLGWQLVAGGSISRVVRGIPDEHPRGYLGSGQHGKAIRNAVVNNTSLHQNYFNRIDMSGGMRYYDQIYDSEPDIFYINTPSFSFQFSFDENGQPVVSNQHGIAVTSYNFINSTNYSNSYFVVKDDQGNLFQFGSSISSRSLTNEELCGQNTTYISSWHLEKIVSTDNSDTINFGYVKLGSNSFEWNYSYNWEYTHILGATSGDLESKEHLQKRTQYYLSYISSKGGSISFSYSPRTDVDGPAYRLASISSSVRSNNGSTLKQKVVLNTSYFGSTNTPPSGSRVSDRCRLRLDSLRLFNGPNDNNGITVKKFEYIASTSAYDRKDNNMDYFGYRTFFQTGDPMKDPSLRIPHSLGSASTYMLEKIIERSGAYNKIIYGFNTFFKNNSQPSVILGGIRVNEIQAFENNDYSLKRRFQYEFDGQSSGEVYVDDYDSFSLYATGTIYSLRRVYSSALSNSTDINGNFLGYARVREINPNDSYTDYYFQSFKNYQDKILPIQSSSAVSFSGGPLSASSISYAHKRGLISKVSSFDNLHRPVGVAHYTYTALNTTEGKAAYGVSSRVMGAAINGHFGYSRYIAVYHTPIENYRLTNVVMKEFIPSIQDTSQNMIQQTAYIYHPNKYLLRSSETKDSKGIVVKKTFYYPEDSNIPMTTSSELATLNTMKNQNIKNVIVHESQQFANNEMMQTHSVFGMPFRLKATNSYRRIASDQTDEKISGQEYFYESGTSNRLGAVKLDNGRYNFWKYDDFDRIVVELSNTIAPSVTDGSPGQNLFFYNSFETQTSLPSFVGRGSHQGPYTVPFVMPANRKYLVDFWSMDSNGKWRYSKMRYTNNMVLGQTTRIDEVRVYPEDAQITTYSYNDLGMKNSESDGFGRVTFYEYDAETRLQLVLDQDRNILKSYCYNLNGENVDCFQNQAGGLNEGCTVQSAPYWEVNSSYIYRSENKLVISYLDLSLDGYGDISQEEWFNYGVQMAYIPESCRPASIVTGQGDIGGRVYRITAYPNGDMTLRVTSSTTQMPLSGYIGKFENIVLQ